MVDVKDGRHLVGFDLGGTKMLAGLFNSSYTCVGRKRRRTRGHEGVEAGLDRIVQTIEKALDEAEVSRSSLAAIGIGCPGPLDLDRGIIFDAPNLGWRNVRIKDRLEKQFDCPTVLLNDVDAGVFGEYRFGAGKGSESVLGVFPGTGIGGGFVYRGEIFRGRKGSCMELGHIQVQPDGPLCGCGQRGCLEAISSRLAIASEAAKAVFRGQAPHLMSIAGTDLSRIRSGALADAIAQGDVAIERIVRSAARSIGTAVGGLVNLMAPDMVILGGGLAEAMPDLFVTEVEEAAKSFALPSFVDSFRVVTAELGDDAAILGAAATAAARLK